MTLTTVFIIAVALGVDAFSVAIGIGAANHQKPWWPPVLRLSAAFGFFQFMMAVIGWLAGSTVVEIIEAVDHWVAFGLLALIGGKMIWEGMEKEEHKKQNDQTRGLSLLILSVATSIDSLAVGFSFSVLKNPIMFPALLIGIVCFFMTAIGMIFGKGLARIFGRKVNIFGGLVLIAIGIKILIEHL
ncbi:MAG TPA: manganese efflux pump MntP family protein [Smithellaceae bacterium]|nr:manganese efflux pump MntP family protein [Smithellaceae bacterium]HRS89918.1 manganese efflux pump MntP family protein [Smithellaceae bacterium]HRV26683.1 manganese efflux pump MntP family protein [Smithellaceae bacterium]